MFAQIAHPEKLQPQELDNYLAAGWFRMRQTIFTTHFLHFNQQFYSAIWLRVSLDNFIPGKKYQSLHKLNKSFRNEIRRTGIHEITTPHELLYLQYRQSISFDVSPSLQELLFGIESFNRFNTHEVNIYDGDTLIAAGFFDMGENSAAGITCIYHPAYKKHSLGKFLIYLKMNYCKQRQIKYFYPGYMVPGYAAFDYKLEIGKASLQYLQLSSQLWVPFSISTPIQNPLQHMLLQLNALQTSLSNLKIPYTLKYYRFFEANLDPYYFGHELFDFPVFLYCFPEAELSFFFVIVYDVRDTAYNLLQCNSVLNVCNQQAGLTIFDTDLLKVVRPIFSSKIPGAMATYLSDIFKLN